MAESTPRPGYPATPCFIADIVIRTPHGRRKNRLYFTPDTPPTQVQHISPVADAIFNFFSPVYVPLMSSLAKFERVDVRWKAGATMMHNVSTIGSVEGSIEFLIGEEGAGDTDLLPDEVTLICRRLTGFGGHSKNGRIFVSGLAEVVQTKGEIDEDYHAEAKALANKLPTDIAVNYDPDGLPGVDPYATFLHARHWDRKNDVLVPIMAAQAVGAVGTRRDRRKGLTLEPIA